MWPLESEVDDPVPQRDHAPASPDLVQALPAAGGVCGQRCPEQDGGQRRRHGTADAERRRLKPVSRSIALRAGLSVKRCVWSSIAATFFLFTLFFLSVALRKIDVGIGYAVWAGIGAIGAAVLGPVFFDETLTLGRAFWLAVIIGGVVWLKLADSPSLTQNTLAETPEQTDSEG